MAEFPGLFLYTDAFIADIAHLDNEEVGVYIKLLIFAWRTRDCALPDDDFRLRNIVGMSAKKWDSARLVMMQFFQVVDGKWRQKKLTAQREKVEGLSKRGRAGAAKRWKGKHLKTKEVDDAQASTEHVQEACETDGIHLHLQKIDSSGVPPPPSIRLVVDARTHRENLLEAMGIDRSGLTGRGGQMIGSIADMDEARRWQADLGLCEADQLAVVREVMARKVSGAKPSTFSYFTQAMQRLSTQRQAAPLETLRSGAMQDARPQRPEGRFDESRLNRIIGGAIGHDEG